MKLYAVVLLISSLVTFYVDAKTDFVLGLGSSVVHSESKTPDSSTVSSDVLTIKPTIGIVQDTRTTRTNANIQHLYVQELGSSTDEEVGNNRSNFTNLDITTRINAIENVLELNGRVNQSYRNTSASNALINDQLSGNRDLTKTTNYRAGFDLTVNRFDYFELYSDGNVTKVNTNRQTNSEDGIDSTTANYTATIFAGKEFRYIDWNFSTDYSESNGTSNNDLIRESYVGNIYIGLVKQLRFVVTGTIEKDDLSSSEISTNENAQDEANRQIEYKTAGVGLSWFRDRSKYVDVSYNISSRSGDDGRRDKFVSVKFGWRFSSRTTATGNFGRRFYGRSAAFSLTHNVRKIRTQISYSEAVTNFSQLIASNLTVGGIVCPIGADDFTQCFIPDTLDYELQPGEEFTSLNFIVPEISEQTILRKNLLFNTNYRFRKLNLTFTANIADTEYLDGSRNEKRENLTLAANYTLSRKLKISWINRFTKFENLVLATETKNTDDIWRSTLSSSYQNNRQLSTSLAIEKTDRKSSVFERNYDGLRVSLSMNYRF